MPRSPRAARGGIVYHVLNRANARMRLFDRESDYEAFETVLIEAHEQVAMRTLAYCILPDHWHFVLWPRRDGDLSEFLRWLTVTHTQRWHAAHGTTGLGHVYQGRFKSFPVQSDEHLLAACRYVESSALRAGLVDRAEDWRWGSLWRRACRCGQPGVAECSPGGVAAKLARLGESPATAGATRSAGNVHHAESAVRQRHVGPKDRPATGVGIDTASPRPAAKRRRMKSNMVGEAPASLWQVRLEVRYAVPWAFGL